MNKEYINKCVKLIVPYMGEEHDYTDVEIEVTEDVCLYADFTCYGNSNEVTPNDRDEEPYYADECYIEVSKLEIFDCKEEIVIWRANRDELKEVNEFLK